MSEYGVDGDAQITQLKIDYERSEKRKFYIKPQVFLALIFFSILGTLIIGIMFVVLVFMKETFAAVAAGI